jgi:hypothetical protein
MGILGMSLMIIITNNTDASILAIMPLLFRLDGWFSSKIEELCTNKIKKIYKHVYKFAYISDMIVIASIFYFLYTHQYNLMVIANLSFIVEAMMYAPLCAVYAYIRMRVFGGSHHLSVFKNKHSSVSSQYDNIVAFAGGLINVAIFNIYPEDIALQITTYIFLALFLLDGAINYYESRYTLPLLKAYFED